MSAYNLGSKPDLPNIPLTSSSSAPGFPKTRIPALPVSVNCECASIVRTPIIAAKCRLCQRLPSGAADERPARVGMGRSLVFLRILRGLRLIHSHQLMRDLRRDSRFFRMHEDGVIAAINLFVMVVGVALFLQLARAIFQPAKVRHTCPDFGRTRHDIDAVRCRHCGRALKIHTVGI